MLFLLTAAVGYLLGTIPFGYLLVRWFQGQDIRATGSGNIGATNVSRTSPALGVATLILDALKGFAAVAFALWLARHHAHSTAVLVASPEQLEAVRRSAEPLLQRSQLLAATAALFAVLGHMFPVWLKFRGGKGVATGLGSFLLLAPKAILLMVAIFVAVVLLFRYISLGSIVVVLLFPLLAWWLDRPHTPAVLLLMVTTSALIVARHHENVRRLLTGTESPFQMRRK
jgi:glycerol-3-phosphate acyltransferase PlsY